jgi:hypothetical protein
MSHGTTFKYQVIYIRGLKSGRTGSKRPSESLYAADALIM